MLWRICSQKAVNYYSNLDMSLIVIRLAFSNLIFLMSKSEKNELNMVQYSVVQTLFVCYKKKQERVREGKH